MVYFHLPVQLIVQLNVMLNAELSPADRECLDGFVRLRSGLARDLDMSPDAEESMPFYFSRDAEEMSTHELLIAEVTGLTLRLLLF